MSKEVLKTAYINFQAKGVQEIRTLIAHLGKDLDKFSASLGQSQLKVANKLGDISNKIKESVKKANEAVLVGTKASTAALGKEVSALKLINKEFKGMALTSKELKSLGGKVSVRITQKSPELLRIEAAEKAAKIEERAAKEAAREKLRAAKEAAREEKAAAREAETRRKNFSNRVVAITKFLGKLGLATYGDYQTRMGLRSENLRYENLLMLSGIGNARARNYAAKMVSLGGSTEGALGTLNALSAGLGGIARGDTGLLQTLGMYGIGGISPRTFPEQLINKIRARVQRGDLSRNEINALLSRLPLDDAQKRAIMSSRADLFSGELGAFSVDERNIQALEKNAIATESLRSSTEKALAFFSPIDNKMSGLIQSNSELIASIMVNSNAIKELAGLIPQIGSSLANSLSGIFGGAAAAITSKFGKTWTSAKNLAKWGVEKTWTPAKNLVKWGVGKTWTPAKILVKWGSRFATIPALAGIAAVGGAAAIGVEAYNRLKENPLERGGWGKGIGTNYRIQQKVNYLMTPSITGGYNMPAIERFNQKYGGQIPKFDNFYRNLHSESSYDNSSTITNYYINYNSPQQDTIVPFYFRNRGGEYSWKRDVLNYAPNY